MKSKCLAILALFPLTACSYFERLLPAPMIPANLTAPCPDLSEPEPTMNLGDLLRYSIETATMYRQCQARHTALSELVQ